MESRCSFLTTALLVFALFSRNILEQIFAHSMCMGIFCTISTVRTTGVDHDAPDRIRKLHTPFQIERERVDDVGGHDGRCPDGDALMI